MRCLKQNSLSGQAGFTLVELISVIVIIGVFLATALPRFVNLDEDAHTGSARSVYSSFASATKLFRLGWRTQGSPSVPSVVDGVSINSNGWPGPAGAANHAQCVAIWQGITDISLPIVPWTGTWAIGDQSWVALGSGGNCFYLYLADTTPLRYFFYIPTTGNIVPINL